MMKVCRNCDTENPLDAVLCSECGMSVTRAPTGEEARKLKAQPAQPPGETPTGQSLLAYRLAAIVLLVGASLNVIDTLVAGGAGITMIIGAVAIDVGLAVWLLRLSGTARLWTVVRAALGAVAWPILAFLGNDALTAILMTMAQWGYSGALVLLLTGQSKTWRLALAVAIFVVFTLGIYGLGFLFIALAVLLGG
jgi:ribosomal protein L40E